ncbi:MAG: hypothetical protein WC867_02840 [Candidatus Pacearchaeota archaeon]|jgi:hypothetical protein
MEILKKKLVFFIVIAIVLITSTNSSPPNLPVIVYGKVISQASEDGLGNMRVQISWDSIKGERITKTVQTSKNSDTKGNFNLEINDIYEGNEIIIECQEVKTSVIATYGLPVKVQDISVELKSKGIISGITEFFEDLITNDDKEKKQNISQKNSSEKIEILTEERIENQSVIIEEHNYTEKKNTLLSKKRAPIIVDYPKQIILCEDNSLNYNIRVDYPDSENLEYDLNPKAPESPFLIKPINSYNPQIKSYQIYSYSLVKSDAIDNDKSYKIYKEKFFVRNSEHADEKNFDIVVIEKNHPPTFEKIKLETLELNEKFTYKLKAEDFEDGVLGFGKLKVDIKFNKNELFNITDDGIIVYQAKKSDLGNHNIEICIKDSFLNNPHPNSSICGKSESTTICNNLSLTITEKNREPVIKEVYPKNSSINIFDSDKIGFGFVKEDPDGTIPESYWYVDNELKEIFSENYKDNFVFNINCNNLGTHYIKSIISDGKLNKSIEWQVNVNKADCNILNKKEVPEIVDKTTKLIIFGVMIALFFILLKLIISTLILKYKLKNISENIEIKDKK